ncbi:MAG: glutaredoxin 3 [Rubellimicrobium sp.]|nr:glutaredoxin 3 [Rubellimicrobium sp.]
MPNVEIYTRATCGYCHRAKALLAAKGIGFTEYDIGIEPGRRAEMMQRAPGRHTVPQIFVDGQHIGDCTEIHALDRAGRLDPLLAA